MQTYVVQMGDTLYGIGKQFGITVEELKLENDLTNNTLELDKYLEFLQRQQLHLYIDKKGRHTL